MSDTTTADKLQQIHDLISNEINTILVRSLDELQDILDSASASIDDFAAILTAIDQDTDNDGKVTIAQLLEVLNSADLINSLLLGWVPMLNAHTSLVITDVQSFMSTDLPIIVASIEQIIDDRISDSLASITEYTATLVDVYSDGLQQFQTHYTEAIDSALGEANEQDGFIDISDVGMNVFTDAIDNDGKLSIDAGQTDLAPLLDELPVKSVHHRHKHTHIDLQLITNGLVALVAILIFVILCLVFGRCSIRSAVKYSKALQSNDDKEDDTQSEDDELIH